MGSLKFRSIFKKKSAIKAKRCDYDSASECPYSSSPAECKFDKTHCLLKNRKTQKHKGYGSLSPIIVCALIGLIVFVLTTIASLDEYFAFPHSKYVYAVVSGIAISVMTGSILAIVIDLPSRLKDYEQSFVNALSSNNYLKSLDEDRLTDLRNEITEQLHKTKAPHMAKGLIRIDQRVCELLRQPYYSRYRHVVTCNEGKNETIEKEHVITYKLINPYSIYQSAVEYIKFSNLVLVDDTVSGESITDLKIFCAIDNGKKIDYSKRIDFEYEEIQDEFYNRQITLIDKDNATDNSHKGIRIEFDDNIEVEMRYKIIVPKNDPCFTKRLQHPVKNFRLDYAFNGDDVELFGQIFGTELKQNDIEIRYTDNSISLETFDWLLPDNGAMVVMLKKQKQPSNHE